MAYGNPAPRPGADRIPPAPPRRRGGRLAPKPARRKLVITPEGLGLDLQIGGLEQRFAGFLVDCLIMAGGMIVIAIVLAMSDMSPAFVNTTLGFAFFIIENFYFIGFELAWRGRTPGKRAVGLQVVRRDGGELTPACIVARNLCRNVELFLPFQMFLLAVFSPGTLLALPIFLWAFGLCFVPALTRDRLRCGDLIGGTMVIALPKTVLLPDLTARRPAGPAFVFTPDQLGIYGNLELQTLERILRQAESGSWEARAANHQTMLVVLEKICRKIGWPHPPPEAEAYRFLREFYLAERAVLEKGLIHGVRKESKLDTPAPRPGAGPPPPGRPA